MIYFSDVDVVLKLARCGFLPWFPELLCRAQDEVTLQYLASLKARLTRPSKKLTSVVHQQHLSEFCSAHSIIGVAADITRQEELLQSGMDTGEALLFAEAEATRGIVVTGDKRALVHYAKFSSRAQRAKIKVVCWEQLLFRVHQLKGYDALKQGCCDGMVSDGLLSLAFSSGLATQEEQALATLESYLNGIKAHSEDILAEFDPETVPQTAFRLTVLVSCLSMGWSFVAPKRARGEE